MSDISPRALNAALLAHGLPKTEPLAQLLAVEPELYAAVMATAERLERIAGLAAGEEEEGKVSEITAEEVSVALPVTAWREVVTALKNGRKVDYYRRRADRRAPKIAPGALNKDAWITEQLTAAVSMISGALERTNE